jgi:hypothetical protein
MKIHQLVLLPLQQGRGRGKKCRLKSSGMLCYVSWYTVTDIPKSFGLFIFRVK